MEYRVIDDADEMDIADIMGLLKQTYWADKRPQEQVELSIVNSRCYGIYTEGEKKLAGFARVITDYATTYYLCDVVIDRKYRRRGLGIALVSHIEGLPEYQGLRGVLITRDAHELYGRFGYRTLNDRVMVKNLDC